MTIECSDERSRFFLLLRSLRATGSKEVALLREYHIRATKGHANAQYEKNCLADYHVSVCQEIIEKKD